jgi:hypothetical protein
MIVQIVDQWRFIEAFKSAGRYHAWSEAGLIALFDYLEDYSHCTGEPLELDVVDLDCNFCEMDIEDIINDYSNHDEIVEIEESVLDDEERADAVEEFLSYHTSYIRVDDETFVVQGF